MHKEVPVPGGFQPFVSEAGYGLVFLQEVEGELGQDGEVLRCHPAPFALLVLAESHVERPVELVLDLPVAADIGVEGGVGREAADVEAFLCGLASAGRACRPDPDDGLEPGPVPIIRPHDGVRLEGLALAHLYPSVPLVDVRVLGCGMLVAAHRLHVLQQGLLVALDGQYVVAAGLDGLPRYVFLRPHRIDGDDASRDVEHVYELGYGRYLVALGVGLVLSEAQRVLHAPCVDDVQRAAAVERVPAPANRLAVYRNHLGASAFVAALQSRRPLREQPLEVACVDGLEHAVDGVVGRYAVGQAECLLQLRMMGLAEQLYGVERIRTA